MSIVDWILVLVFNFSIALTLPFSKKALTHFEPFTMQGIKCSIILILIAPFLTRLKKNEAAGIFITSVFLFTGCYSLGAMAIQLTENQNAIGFVSMLEAPVASILGIILLKEVISLRLAISLGLSVVGASIICFPSGGMEFGGFILLTISIILGGLGQIFLKKSVDSVSPHQAILWCYVFSVPQFFLLSYFEEKKSFDYLELSDVAVVALMSLIAMVSWSVLIKRHSVSMLQPFYLLTVVTIPLSNYFILGQKLSTSDFFGATFIFLGAFLVSKPAKQEGYFKNAHVSGPIGDQIPFKKNQ